MPGGYPTLLNVSGGVSYGVLGYPLGTNIPPSLTASTKGSWTQITASTTQDCTLLDIFANQRQVTGRSVASIDIGIGASGSENILIPDLVLCNPGENAASRWILPINIPSGTRISARSQALGTATGVICTVLLTTYDGGFTQDEGFAGVDTMGFISASTAGTTLTPGVAANAKGSYAQLIASTTRDYIGVFGAVDLLGASSGVETYWIDVAVGASGSEQIIVPQWGVYLWDVTDSNMQFIPVIIPAGTRVSARAGSADGTGGGALNIGFTLYGVYQ